MATSQRAARSPALAVTAVVLLALTALLPAVAMSRKSPTYDEVAHLPAGYSYLRTGRIVLNPMHPPLVKELAALPLLFFDDPVEIDAAAIERLGADVTYQRELGRRFFSSPARDRLLFWGRVPAVLLSLALAIVVAVWASELWGPAGAVVALWLYCFDPTITAHAQLVTTDVGLAAFAVLFVHRLRAFVRTGGWGRAAAAGAALGAALGTKFTALALIPVGAALLAFGARERRLSTRTTLAGGAAIAGVAFAVLWIIYLCPGDLSFYARALRTLRLDNDPTYLSYFRGELRAGSWPSYFLVAWLVKTPLPSLILLAAAIAVFARGRRAHAFDEACLVVPPLAFLAAYTAFGDPSGVRYLIPCFPFLFVFAGRVGALENRASRALVAVLLVWHAVEFARIWPDHLSYFNQIAGGARGGTHWLDDSNVDWGQGLVQLREHLAKHPSGDLRLCYFGDADPGLYGIAARPLSIGEATRPPSSGTWILSAHCVARARAWAARRGGSDWLDRTEPDEVVGHAYYVYSADGQADEQ